MTEPRDLTTYYKLEHVLSWTGSARTFRGVDPETGKPVVVKLLSLSRVPGAEALTKRFLSTAGLLQSLTHKALPRLLDYGETPTGDAYLVVEWFDGKAISTQTVAPHEALAIAISLSEALESLSLHGLVHLNISPGNVLYEESGRVQLTGWGASLLSVDWQSSPRPGAPRRSEYTAPELLEEGTVGDALWRADLYSLAALTAHLLGARVESGDEGKLVRFDSSLSSQVQRPEELRSLLERCMKKEPDHRPDSYSEVARTLQHSLPRIGRGMNKGVTETQPVERIRPEQARSRTRPTTGEFRSPFDERAQSAAAAAADDADRTIMAPAAPSEDATVIGPTPTFVLEAAAQDGGQDGDQDADKTMMAPSPSQAAPQPPSSQSGSSTPAQPVEMLSTDVDVERTMMAPLPETGVGQPESVDPSDATMIVSSGSFDPDKTMMSPAGGPGAPQVPASPDAAARAEPEEDLSDRTVIGPVSFAEPPAPGPPEAPKPAPPPVAPTPPPQPQSAPPPPEPKPASPPPAKPPPSSPAPPKPAAAPPPGASQTTAAKKAAQPAAVKASPAKPPSGSQSVKKPKRAGAASGGGVPRWVWLAAAGLFGLVVVVAGVLFLARGFFGADEPVVAVAPEPTPIPTVAAALDTQELTEAAPAIELPDLLLTALEELDEGNLIAAREAIDDLNELADEGLLDPAVCEAVRSVEETILISRARSVTQRLGSAYSNRNLGAVRNELSSLTQRETEMVVSDSAGARLIADSRQLLERVEAFEQAQNDSDLFATMALANGLQADYPRVEGSLQARERTAADIEQSIDRMIGSGRLEQAREAIGRLRALWPERAGLSSRLDRIAQMMSSRDRFEDLLRSIAQTGADSRPHEGLETLEGVQFPSSYQARADALRTQLRQQLASLDEQSPSVEVVGGVEAVEYRRGRPVSFELDISDDYEVVAVELGVRFDAAGSDTVRLTRGENGRYAVLFAPNDHNNRPIAFWVTATDRSGQNGTLGSSSSPIELRRRGLFRRR